MNLQDGSLVYKFLMIAGAVWLVLALGPGNPPAVLDRTAKTVRFIRELSKNPDYFLLVGQTEICICQSTDVAAFE